MPITTSWKTPTTSVGSAVTGDPGTVAWSNLGFERVDNDSGATALLQNTAVRSRLIRVYGFGFAADIPAGSTILGVEINIKRLATTASRICDDVLYLTDDATVANVTQRIGGNRATATGWPTAYAYEAHGGAADLWDATLTAAIVRGTTFGIHFAAKWYSASAGGAQANVDAISMRITFEPPPVTGNYNVTEGDDTAVSTPDYVPALDLDFVTSETPDPRLTISGGENGTRTNSAGVLVAASAPRYDYDPITLAPVGVLREQARTNLLLNSLLDGTPLPTQSITVTAAAHTLSFYGTGTVTLSGAATGSLVGSGAYPVRSTLAFTPSAGSLTVTVSGTVQFAQITAGAFVTSFIPTAGSAVTRSADDFIMTGSGFSPWFNPAEGTIYTEFIPLNAGIAYHLLNINDSTANNEIRIAATATNTEFFAVAVGNVVVASLTVGVPAAGVIQKVVGAYKLDDFAASANGGAVVTDNVGGIPTVSQMNIGVRPNGTLPFGGRIRRIRYYNQRLPNAVLQALTTAITGSAAITEANDNAVGAGQVKVHGQASITEAGDTAAAAGETGIPLLTPGGRIAAAASSRLSNRTAAVAPSRLANRIAQ